MLQILSYDKNIFDTAVYSVLLVIEIRYLGAILTRPLCI